LSGSLRRHRSSLFVSMMFGSSPISTAVAAVPQLGKNLVTFELDLQAPPTPSAQEGLAFGICQLFSRGTLCDVNLVVGNREFAAHRAVLASASQAFCTLIENADAMAASSASVATAGEASFEVANATAGVRIVPPAPLSGEVVCAAVAGASEREKADYIVGSPPLMSEVGTCRCKVLRLPGISSPEAVEAMLDCIYEFGVQSSKCDHGLLSDEAIIDMLRLARQFNLHPLVERALRYLTSGLSTANVVERLAACEEFELVSLRDKIIESLKQEPKALTAVANNMEILRHPRLLQDLLMQVVALFKDDTHGTTFSDTVSSPPAKKKATSLPEKEKAAKRARRASVGGA